MNKKEAEELIKSYVLENFDDRWYPGPTYLEEYPDFFLFYINSKKIMETGDWHHGFVGLGSGYISKTYGEIVQYGSAPSSINNRENFLETEHKLNVVRTKYKIERIDYFYTVTIENIIDKEKASKYIDEVKEHLSDPTSKGMKDCINFKLRASGLLNLLYINTIEPFCDIYYEKKIIKGYNDEILNPHSPLYDYYGEVTPFQKHILDAVIKLFPTFRVDEAYTSKITNISDIDRLHQYLPIAGFRYYGEDDQTGFVGYVLGYSDDEIQQMILDNNIAFEFTKGEDILFFLFMNSIEPFCDIELKKIPDELIKDGQK